MGAQEDATGTPVHGLLHLVQSDDELLQPSSDDAAASISFSSSSSTSSADEYHTSPMTFPYNLPPLTMLPWTEQLLPELPPCGGLVASLVHREGHVHSLATAGDLLYTGLESRNIRVWKGREELSCFGSGSGFVKAIVVAGGRVFTGHRDGQIRIWRTSSEDPSLHKRIGTLPTIKASMRSSMNPLNYVQVRRRRRLSALWFRHVDVISCLSLDEAAGLLYSGSWDKTVKAWRVSDSKCLDSFIAHDDAINAVAAAGFDSLVFTGSADGTVKAWRREVAAEGKGHHGAANHVAVMTLMRQEGAVTALVAVAAAGAVYCASSEGVVQYWLRERGRELPARGEELQGHGMAVLCLAAACSIVASGSADRTVRVWRREKCGTHCAVAILIGHTAPVKCLAVKKAAKEPGCVVYSGGLDKAVKIWRVPDYE